MTFRVREWSDRGKVISREIEAESIADLKRGPRCISIEIRNTRGTYLPILRSKQPNTVLLSRDKLEALRQRLRELPGSN